MLLNKTFWSSTGFMFNYNFGQKIIELPLSMHDHISHWTSLNTESRLRKTENKQFPPCISENVWRSVAKFVKAYFMTWKQFLAQYHQVCKEAYTLYLWAGKCRKLLAAVSENASQQRWRKTQRAQNRRKWHIVPIVSRTDDTTGCTVQDFQNLLSPSWVRQKTVDTTLWARWWRIDVLLNLEMSNMTLNKIYDHVFRYDIS